MPSVGARTSATTVATSSADDEQRVRQDVAERQRQRPPVEHDQRSRPERQAQVVSDHHRLVEQVGPRDTPVENPPTADRGPDHISAASTSHVAARPRTEPPARRERLSRNESNTKTRSYSATTIGAVTIDSLHAMPSAHEQQGDRRHRRQREGEPAPRAGSRRASAGRTAPSTTRCAPSGSRRLRCSADARTQSSATANAEVGRAWRRSARRIRGSSSVRRTTPNASSAQTRWIAMLPT